MFLVNQVFFSDRFHVVERGSMDSTKLSENDGQGIKFHDTLNVVLEVEALLKMLCLADTSNLWIQNQRELPGLQSAPYYNVLRTPHGYMPSHTAHTSVNAAASLTCNSKACAIVLHSLLQWQTHII
ncbi:hypothetical protein J1N35_031353 [Gossypium stocksii]|uniref:Uncharacterized protein n=1 Tax=Gossypium stocksii TaxID=47602 RepID=A0A9D3ZTN0_9ROSI|nr:hypothetical protein J1N35_031353 [Gossypium stocksii]